MSTMQIRDVPDDVSRTLKARAATAGQSLSEFLLGELTRLARRPTLEEALLHLRSASPRDLPAAATVLAAARRQRGA